VCQAVSYRYGENLGPVFDSKGDKVKIFRNKDLSGLALLFSEIR
jgi:hypothetical protein